MRPRSRRSLDDEVLGGQTISSKAVSCPRCGEPNPSGTAAAPKKRSSGRGWIILAAVVAGVTLLGVASRVILTKRKPPPSAMAPQARAPDATQAAAPAAQDAAGCSKPPFEVLPPGMVLSERELQQELANHCPGAIRQGNSYLVTHEGRSYRIETAALQEPNGLRTRRIQTIRGE